MQSTERWLPVVGYEGIYEVSSSGRVRRIGKARGAVIGRILAQTVNANGYLTLRLYDKDGIDKPLRVHRIVAEAFCGPAGPGETDVCHRNDIRTDNRAENLEWGSRSDNLRQAVERLRHSESRKTHCKWGHEFNAENTRFTDRQRVCRICQRVRRKEFEARVNKLRLQSSERTGG